MQDSVQPGFCFEMRDYVFDEQLRKRVAGPAGFTMSAVAETALHFVPGMGNFPYDDRNQS
jgi:hypothetical protein